MRSQSFSTKLIGWYRRNARDLPWRRTKDPYKIWISEVMLQQTTVNAVIPYYKRWIKVFPDIQSVAKATQQKVLKQWQGLGYYQRAKNIHKSAKIIIEKFNAKIPNDCKTLSSLPGFGSYTVGAVLSIAFDKRHPIIDANVRRVIMRQKGMKGMANTSHDKNIKDHLVRILPRKCIGDFNQGLMELGALICRRKEPVCNICPVCAFCIAYKKDIQETIPQTKKKYIKNIDAVVAIIKNNGKYLMQKRPSKGLLADLWEFPGGKIKKAELPIVALARELKEELDCDLMQQQKIMETRHWYTEFCVHLNVYDCTLQKYPLNDRMRKWVNLKEMDRYPMPSGTAKIVDRLKSHDNK